MKPIKQKKCRSCKELFTPFTSLSAVCSLECAIEESKKQKKKRWAKEKREYYDKEKGVQQLAQETQVYFNKFIRKRDEGLNCISCQKPPKKKNAGHYFNANNHWAVRFYEDNVHLQCEACNSSLSGNLIEYRKHLINKIGRVRFNVLESMAYDTRNFTKEELKELKEIYKEKIKQLK